VKHLEPEVLAQLALHPDQPVEAAVHEHLSGCAQCRAEVDELRGVAELSRSARSDAVLTPAPPQVWDRVVEELDLQAVGPADEPDEAAPAVEPVPITSRTARPRRLMLAAAASVGLVVGVLSTWLVTTITDEAPPPVATVQLEPLAGKSGNGSAELFQAPGGPELRVGAQGLAAAPGYYEVWLINTDGARMVSLGVLDTQGDGTFRIPADLVDEGYTIVDVSLEPYDGNPVHSRDSVIRGNLPA
jgi:anti-sigma-K factor RskA